MFKYWKKDLPASIVVFFVALPLCLGVAVASGAPAFAGIITGAIGGIVVGLISQSSIGVSGPAAGLMIIVMNAVNDLGYEVFLIALILAGIIQLVLGIIKAGVIGYYFPSAVISGMLCAIGIMIFFQQIPDALGFEKSIRFESFKDMKFSYIFRNMSLGAVIITTISLIILISWERVISKKSKFLKLLPGSLVAVIVGVVLSLLFSQTEKLALSSSHLVNVPIIKNASSFFQSFTFPGFGQASFDAIPKILTVAITIAVVASIETLLSVEAADKMDPLKRQTPTNRELIAQGAGNALAGLVGGIPVTQVIVRSSANVQSGGVSKLSTIFHGFLLLISVILLPKVLNMIPNAVLAGILLIVGYKLANPKLFVKIFRLGKSQYIPFIVTVITVLSTDLLIGILTGLTVSIMTILIRARSNSHVLHIHKEEDGSYIARMKLAQEISFLNKEAITKELNKLKENTQLILDITETKILDYDILEVFDDFADKAKSKNINIRLLFENGKIDNPKSFRSYFRRKRFAVIEEEPQT